MIDPDTDLERVTEPVKAHVTIAEKIAVEEAAAAEGRTVSSWLRQLIRAALERKKRCQN